MSTFRSGRWSALAMTFGVMASAARAEMITPDSIPNPPSAVGSANGTTVPANGLVYTQYMGLGLGFNYGDTAITRLNGVSVWVPVWPIQYSGSVPSGTINYSAPWYGASLNSLTTRNPITVSSLFVETIGNPGILTLQAYGRNGLPLSLVPVLLKEPGPNGGELWSFTGAGIWGFNAAVVPPPGYADPGLVTNAPWGVASVSFALPAGQAPEPSSLVLAGLGALGLTARWSWKRRRMAPYLARA